ncbi:MAG: peptide deformylase [Candidatus Omnitrophota bacterium]|jgi:peptide deformylase
MSILEIKKYPEKVLRKKCKPVSQITKRESYIFKEMLFTMRHFSGIGLAAPQVGILEKLIVVEFEGITIKLANPEILKIKGADIMEEGCLSFPDKMVVAVKRPSEAITKGLNENGQLVEIKAKGILARALQHEIDHLCGKLIIDYLSFRKKLKFKLKPGF